MLIVLLLQGALVHETIQDTADKGGVTNDLLTFSPLLPFYSAGPGSLPRLLHKVDGLKGAGHAR